MKTRIGQVLLIAIMMIPFSGCPRPSVSTGIWLFNVEALGAVGLTLLDGGQTENPSPLPPGAVTSFVGTLTWSLTGRTFTMQQTGGVEASFAGTLNSSRSIIDGTSDLGAWSAVKL